MLRNDICPRCRRIVDISLRDAPVWDSEKCVWVHGHCQQLILQRRIDEAHKKARRGTLTIEEATQTKDDEMELLGLREMAKHQNHTTRSDISAYLSGAFQRNDFDGNKCIIHTGETSSKDKFIDSSTKIFSNKDPRFIDITIFRNIDQNLIEQERIKSRKKIEEGFKRLALKNPGLMKKLGYKEEVIKEVIMELSGGEEIKMLPGKYQRSPYARYVCGEITLEEMRALEEQDDIAGRKRKWITEAK
jgi:hypothetical protein